LLLNMPLGGFR